MEDNKAGLDAVLTVEELSLFRHKDRPRSVAWRVHAGETHVLFGPMGAGRTLLFEILTGLARARQGEIAVLGRDIARYETIKLRRDVAWVQPEPLFLTRTIRTEMLELARRYGIATHETEAKDILSQLAPWLLESLGTELTRLDPDEKIAVDIVRRVVAGANIVLLDELPGGRYNARAKSLLQRVRSFFASEGLSAVVAVSRPAEAEMEQCKSAFMWGGEILAGGVYRAMETRGDLFELRRYLAEPW